MIFDNLDKHYTTRIFLNKIKKLTAVLMGVSLLAAVPVRASETIEPTETARAVDIEAEAAEDDAEATATTAGDDGVLQLQGPAAVLIDANSGVVMYDGDMNKRMYPASTTKVMTALLLLEYVNRELGGDMQAKVSFSYEAVHNLEYGSSHIAMDAGDTLTVEECLYAIMLPSANDVANAVAEFVSGSNERFAELMTARAKELGALDTNFVNPHGLYDDNHYTTPYDMALIMREAITHEEFVTAISTYQYTIPDKRGEAYVMHNSNKMIRSSSEFYNADIVGGKTGYTDAARHSLVTYAERDGMRLITAVLGAEKWVPYYDTTTMLDYGFEHFSEITFNADDYSETISVINDGAVFAEVNAMPCETLTVSLPDNVDASEVVSQCSSLTVDAPVAEGDIVGTLSYTYQGCTLATVNLVAQSEPVPLIIDSSDGNEDGDEAEEQGIKANTFGFSLPKLPANLIPVLLAVVVVAVLVMIIYLRRLRSIRREQQARRRSYRSRYRNIDLDSSGRSLRSRDNQR